jgi:hypothetical protein
MYPHAFRRDCKGEPEDICRAAATAAGELDFLDRHLLPFLRDQEASAENRSMCQRVTFDNILTQAKSPKNHFDRRRSQSGC